MSNEKIHRSIFLEGSSCSGKTCLLKTVNNDDVEVVFKKWPSTLETPSLGFFMERDEDKLNRARESLKSVSLVDRGYLSTLTFYSVLEEQEGISARPVYQWVAKEMGKKLYHPDRYVFLNVPADVTIDRAKKAGRAMPNNNMWFKFPERIDFWYKKLLNVFDSGVPVYNIDGNRNPSIISEEFNDLLSDLKKGVTK